MNTTDGLPANLYRYFWDYQPAELTWEQDRDLIIRRILTAGSWEAIIWLRNKMGDQTLQEWLISHQARGLSARQIRFWELILGLPKQTVDSWIRTIRSNPWGKR